MQEIALTLASGTMGSRGNTTGLSRVFENEMSELPLDPRSPSGSDEWTVVAGAHETLESVARWVAVAPAICRFVDVIAQDEFTFDVVVQYRDRFIVFDTT